MKYRDPETGEFKEIYFKAADTLPIGSVIAFAGDAAPTNWLICDGREVSRETYKDLFSKIGTHYGEGDGETTFNLPNLAGKVAVGYNDTDEDFNSLGNTGGEKEHTLTIEEMPSHGHSQQASVSNNSGYNNIIHGTGYSSDNALYQTTAYTGGSQPHNILQPYVVVNYIIKAFQSAGVVAEVANTESDSTKNTYSCEYVNNKINDLNTEIDELNDRDIYSTEETVIGTWNDGRTVYRRCFEGVLSSDADTTIVTQEINANSCDILDTYGWLEHISNGIKQGMTLGGYLNANWYSGVFVNSSVLTLYCSQNQRGASYKLIVEYLKK